DSGIPLLHRGTHEHAVAHEAGVVHHHVQTAKVLQRRGDDAPGAVPFRDVVAAGDRLPAERTDLRNHFGSGGAAAADTGQGRTEVVDDDLRALARERQRVGAPEPAPGAGYDDDPPRTQ